MRHSNPSEARPSWKDYRGRPHPCLITAVKAYGETERVRLETEGWVGVIHTGGTAVFCGYYVLISGPAGEEWLGEDRTSLRVALQRAADEVAYDGRKLLAVGLDPEWQETGPSVNTGFGVHSMFDRAAHMLDAPRRSN